MERQISIQKVRAFLPKVRVFSGLTPAEILLFTGAAEEMEVDADSLIIKEGSTADSFYVIYDGEAEITKEDGTSLATLKSGDVFGEVALVYNKPRSASVTTTEDSVLLRFSFTDYKEMEKEFPQVVKKIHNNVARVVAQRSWSM